MTPDAATRALIRRAYEVFNARDMDGALALMTPEVEWPNGMEGGCVQGHAGVRHYWTRQWGMINPHVEPLDMTLEDDGRVAVAIQQTIRDLSGGLLNERSVIHVYRLRDGLVDHMEIREA
ncbi:MAG TPA: nuclear transport factor 2 family protein [Tepidiformaceae bacterium]|nr:nuclear transport factor 2 family protein [Tepidiformaceae bacterium]